MPDEACYAFANSKDHSLVARRLAGAGLAVFPVDPTTKRPPHGFKWREQSTSDPTVVENLWEAYPGMGVAIDIGKSGLVVIDADRHGGPDGVDAFEALAASHGGLPRDTPRVLTAGCGEHYYFRNVDPPLGNSAGSLPAGIDVRGSGGYALAPGTKRTDGTGWHSAPDSPDLAEAFAAGAIPPLPGWLEENARTPRHGDVRGRAHGDEANETRADQARGNEGDAPRGSVGRREYAYASAALEKECAAVAATTAGGRNNRLNLAALKIGHMVGAGWIGRAEVEQAVFLAGITCGIVDDDGENAARATIKSGLDAGIKDPHAPLNDSDSGARNGAEDERFGTKAAAGAPLIVASPYEWEIGRAHV